MCRKSSVQLSRTVLFGISALLGSTVTLGAPTDPLCALVDESLQASLQLQKSTPVQTVQQQEIPGGTPINTVTCTWTSLAQDRVLTLTTATSGAPGDMPVSCHEQAGPEQTMLMCMASSGGPMVTAVLLQKGQNANPKLLPTLRAHTEALASKWGKLTRKP